MEFALEILTKKLKSTGMNQEEIDSLLAKFLEEEAFDYVDFIKSEIKRLKTKKSEAIFS